MLVTCSSCHAQYSVADDKVQGRSVGLRCRSCQSPINLGGASSQSQRAAGPRNAFPPPAQPGSRGNGNDESQMFTLAALVGRATAAPARAGDGIKDTLDPRKPMPGVKKESSGVIDLNALARAAEERARRAASEPPPSAFAREARATDEPPPIVSRKVRYAMIAAAAGVLSIVGVVVAVSGGDEPKPRAAVATQAPEPPKADPAALSTPAPTPAPAAVAATPSQSSSSDDKDKVASTPKNGKRWSSPRGGKHAPSSGSGLKLAKVSSGGTGSSFSAKSAPAAAPAPKAKPTPASDPCNCKGNLQCAIKCFK